MKAMRALATAGFAFVALSQLAGAQPAPSDPPRPPAAVPQQPDQATKPQATPDQASQTPSASPPVTTQPNATAGNNAAPAAPPREATPAAAPATAPPAANVQTARPPAAPAPTAPGACCAAPPQSDAWTSKDWATVIGALVGALSSFLAFFVGMRAIGSNLRSTESNNNQKTNEAELKAIEEKLDQFFGPYLQLSNTNKLIANELKARHPEAPEMRILLLLIDPDWRGKFSPGDATAIDEIIEIDKSLLALIHDKAGLVDARVQPYLYRAAAHFRMMIRAHESKLDNQPATYRSYVYPRQLDDVIQLEVDRLKARIALLREKPTERHRPMAPLVIPAELALGEWPPAGTP